LILQLTGEQKQVQLSSDVKTLKKVVRAKIGCIGAGEVRETRGKQLAGVFLLSLVLCSVANHVAAHWLGISQILPWTHVNALYRRVGPRTGPQVFCGGSSLLVAGLVWSDVAESLGQGVENWTVAGSSPEVWEVFQQQKRNSNTTIIGISIYDLNEMRLTPDRASFVPLATTLTDLWSSQTGHDLRQRILVQYAMSYVRAVFPLAGDSDKVLVELRRKSADLVGKQASLQQYEGTVVEKQGELGVVDSTEVSKWPADRVLRRIQVLREEDHGGQEFFHGPKNRALRRVLLRAQEQGRVIVVVLPVSQYYIDALLDKTAIRDFERALSDTMAAVPQATLVRLDQVPGISDNKNFLDLVHMNSSGRRMATPAFVEKVKQMGSEAKPQTSLALETGPSVKQ
jgi:hypothetical protein